MTKDQTDGKQSAAENPDAPMEGDAPASSDLPCGDLPLTTRIEALLISAERPLGEARISALLALPGKGTAAQVRDAIAELNSAYQQTGRAFRIEKLAGGWRILTVAECGELLARLHTDRQQSRLSQAALETLAIIAYRQPIMRAEVEAIRGVACGEVLRGLLERRLVKVVGRAEELGRPMLYGTTKEFLKVFGLSGTDDLPIVEGARPDKKAAAKPASPPPPTTAAEDKPTGDDEAAEPGEGETPVVEIETRSANTADDADPAGSAPTQTV